MSWILILLGLGFVAFLLGFWMFGSGIGGRWLRVCTFGSRCGWLLELGRSGPMASSNIPESYPPTAMILLPRPSPNTTQKPPQPTVPTPNPNLPYESQQQTYYNKLHKTADSLKHIFKTHQPNYNSLSHYPTFSLLPNYCLEYDFLGMFMML